MMQYARSTDPEVLAAMERNETGHAEACKKIHDFLKQFGTTQYYPKRPWGSTPVAGIVAVGLKDKPEGHGQWVWGYNKRGVRPGKRNPLLAEMEALDWQGEPIPGLEASFEADGSPGSFQMWFLRPHLFRSLGAAWVMLSMLPDRGEFGPQWHEVKASEAHAAKEALADAKS